MHKTHGIKIKWMRCKITRQDSQPTLIHKTPHTNTFQSSGQASMSSSFLRLRLKAFPLRHRKSGSSWLNALLQCASIRAPEHVLALWFWWRPVWRVWYWVLTCENIAAMSDGRLVSRAVLTKHSLWYLTSCTAGSHLSCCSTSEICWNLRRPLITLAQKLRNRFHQSNSNCNYAKSTITAHFTVPEWRSQDLTAVTSWEA